MIYRAVVPSKVKAAGLTAQIRLDRIVSALNTDAFRTTDYVVGNVVSRRHFRWNIFPTDQIAKATRAIRAKLKENY